MDETGTTDGRHGRWRPEGTPPEGQRLALYRLAAALRRMNALMVDSDMGEADLLTAAETAETLVARLAAAPRGRDHWGYAESAVAGHPGARLDDSPMIGLGNPIAPPMRLEAEDEGTLVGRVTFGAQYEGPPGCVHGGYIAAAFDEVLGSAQNLAGKSGLTAKLEVDYRSPTPLHTELVFRARVDRVEGRKKFTSATLHAGDRLCAEATALFVTVRQGLLDELDRARVSPK